MTFLAGAIVGVVAGFVAATLLARRRADSSSSDGSANGGGRDRGLAVAIAIAALALVVAAIALVRSDQSDGDAATTTSASASSSTVAATTSTSAAGPSTTASASVAVPDLVGLSRAAAVAALTRAGLRPSFSVLSLANVPPGFVVSQNPLAASLVAPGSTVALVVSAAG